MSGQTESSGTTSVVVTEQAQSSKVAFLAMSEQAESSVTISLAVTRQIEGSQADTGTSGGAVADAATRGAVDVCAAQTHKMPLTHKMLLPLQEVQPVAVGPPGPLDVEELRPPDFGPKDLDVLGPLDLGPPDLNAL